MNRAQELPQWDYNKSTPPVSQMQALRIARKWLASRGVIGTYTVEEIVLRAPFPTSEGFEFAFHYRIRFGNVHAYLNHMTCIVLMDGTVLEPEVEHPVGSVGSQRDAQSLMGMIRPGMTVAQIREMIPHSKFSHLPVVEHGGEWYDITISDDYIIQFRAAHPRSGQEEGQNIINYSPRLRNGRTLAFVSGEERPW